MADNKKISPAELKALKASGFIKEKGDDLFTVRLRVPGGRLPVEKLRRIVEVAEKYGQGEVHLSVRQSLELLHVQPKDFDAMVAELGEKGQQVAVCGASVRVPTACGGCSYNPNGLMDTQKSAAEVDKQFLGKPTGHHKFKVGFAGCPHDCPKSATNDVGFQGALLPAFDASLCVGCGLCAKRCASGAIAMGADKRPRRDAARCVWCGDCVKVCPTQAWTAAKRGYTVRIGGKWGRQPLVGSLFATFLQAEQVAPFLEAVLAWYAAKAAGRGRVRIGDVLRQEGASSLLDQLRQRFPEAAVSDTIPPQVVRTQVGQEL